MAVPFFRRHKLFLLNVSSGSGLLALGDLFAQLFYEKKKHLDDKRLGMFIDASLVTTHALIPRSCGMCHWIPDGRGRACLVQVSRPSDR